MKVKLFTHTDLDGVGCAIVAKYAFQDVDVEYCNYDEINIKIEKFTATEQYRHYDKVFITDISVNEKVANLIDFSISRDLRAKDKYKLIDHHVTAKWLNKFDWAEVNDLEISIYPPEEYMKSSGTSLFYHYIWENYEINISDLLRFVELVRRFDTWEWNTKFKDKHAKQLNDLLTIIGRDKFIERFELVQIVDFSRSEKMLLDIEEKRIKEYIEQKEKELIVKNDSNGVAGIVFAERYHSELGNELAKNHPEVDFIVMVNMGDKKISYRGIKDDFHLGDIAKRKYGGGGHAKAAGCQLNEKIISDVLEEILQI
ncbi:hypothetical protein EEL31_08895 [Brevibacillus laterosporus]|nr:DHHA1 domain-containing protein [Brevibacillus laterosporus]TPG68624.1 hypothetical protein EEL31_08895 [Brevibacillus laterosporus]